MSSRSLPVLLVLSCVTPGLLAADPDSASSDSTSDAVSPTPASLDAAVEFALRLELEGRNTDRNSLLLQVLEDDPNHAAAHWHLGHIKVGETWLPYDRVIHEDGDRWHRLYLYRKNRQERGDAVNDHVYLADGARERGMRDEERAHLTRIVELDWDNAEARQRLGDVQVDGFWVTREEVDAFLRTMLEIRTNIDEWTPRIQPIVNRLQRSRRQAWELARDDLFAIRDPAAIPAVETALAAADADAAALYLDWLSQLNAWEAAVALARQAVHAPSPSVRAQAQQFLQARRIDDYAPILLSLLRADPDIQSHTFVTPLGGLMYVQHARVETQNDIRTLNLAVTYGPEQGVIFTRRGFTVAGAGSLVNNPDLSRWALDHLHRYYGAFSHQVARDVAADSFVGNERLVRTLAAAVGRDDLQTSAEWWHWWDNYQQVYSPGVKPHLERNYEEAWSVERRRGVYRTPSPDVQVVVNCSCFAAGTPVISEYGPKPIEEIQLGDRVLSQDVETGELAFKPVLKTTVRPPVGLVRITTKNSELVCTAGHPFWVNDHNWLYAHELAPGLRVHSMTGGEEITVVEDAGREEQAYNLIVADFHTYFAGESRVLSHDNTPRSPTDALVPGLMPDWSIPAEDDVVADN